MTTIDASDTVGSIVARRPALSHVFEECGVDYCCGGKRRLDDVCRELGVTPDEFVARLEHSALQFENVPVIDAAAMSLTELADHIEQTHHSHLRVELPRLDKLTEKVARVHGDRDRRLHHIRSTFVQMANGLMAHMMKEEQVLFPIVRKLDGSQTAQSFHCGSIANPIKQMGLEHLDAGSALEQFRSATDNYATPEWACNTYRAMVDALARLELDMHQHVHKEDNVLFPRAMKLEAELASTNLK